MRDKIAEVIASGHGINYFGTDEELDVTASLILDLIAKELDSPEMLPILAELVCGCETRRQEDVERDDLMHQDRSDLYIKCLKDIKHKLGVE